MADDPGEDYLATPSDVGGAEEDALDAQYRRAILYLIDQHRSETDGFIGTPGTLGHVVAQGRTTRRCVLGPIVSTVRRSDVSVRNRRLACVGGKCPWCVDWWIVEKVMLRALRLWEFSAVVYRVEWDAEAWPNEQAARRYRAEHPLHLRVRNGSTFVTFSPAPSGGDAVETVPALLEAVLDAPYKGRRYEFARSQERRDREAVIGGSEESPEADVYSTRVPRAYDLEALRRRYAPAVEGDWEREPGQRGTPFTAADTASVAEDRIDLAVEINLALRDELALERGREREAARMARDPELQRMFGWSR